MGAWDAPWEYVELILCRDVYHCTPLELQEIPIDTIMAHLACIKGESKYNDQEQKRLEQKAKRGR